MSDYGLSILPQHAEMLAASGITPEHARARGYVSVDTKKRLEGIGVTRAGRRVPGLLVPQLRADGSTWGYQYRPDAPRDRDGKPVKYETPVGQRNGIDVPPGVAEHLDDPAVPLWITEGVKKADAGALAGLCVVALPGVWSWRGSNGKGGKVAVPDWHGVALEGRRVVLAFDGDVSRKPAVRAALDALAGYLQSKGAVVEYLHLPDTDDKTGLDDYLAAGHNLDDLHALVRPEPPIPSGSDASAGSSGSPERVCERRTDPDRPVESGHLLSEVRAWLARFVVTMHDADLDLLVLWAAHTHLCRETYTTPRLVLDSPVPGSGKTTVLEHLERLCLHPVQAASLSSPALLTRMLDADLRTILIDEADRSLHPDKPEVAELIAVLNSGYKRGGTRPTLVPNRESGWTAKEMPTFAPVCMAGNNPSLPEDTKSRSIRVLLMPDTAGEAEESDWELYDADARELGQRLSRWAEQVREAVRVNRPEVPEGVRGRARERWAPLKRVAVAAGGRWPGVVDHLAVLDVARIEAEREEGIMTERPAVVLLRHLHAVWGAAETFVPTEELIDRLVDAHPEVWGEESTYGKRLTPQRLGRMLVQGYDVHSDRTPDGDRVRGYRAASLEPAWGRFGLTHRRTSDTPRGYMGTGVPPVSPTLSQEPDRPDEPAEPDARCTACGLVMTFVEPGQATHPGCEVAS